MTMRTLEYAYQVALKAEEKLARKQSQGNRGKNPNRGREIIREKFQKPKTGAEKYHSQTKRGGSSRGGHYGGRKYFSRVRGRGKGREVKCYSCGKIGHMSWDCPDKNKDGEAHFSEARKRNVEEETT
jgi:hypothetical protein